LEHQLIVVGIGPGSTDYILPEALQAIEAATFLVGGKRALQTYAKPQQQTLVVDANIAGLLQRLQQQLAQSDVVVMVSGDPGYYSLLETFRRELPKARLRVIPGISSFQLAFARIGLPWQTARLLSAHGRKPEPELLEYKPGLVLSFLTDTSRQPATIAGWLQEHGWPASSRAWLCKNLSYPDETIRCVSLAEALNIIGFDSCVMVVIE
jgi:cobalt-precorrin-7 (C5)-methyltransferase